MNFPLRGYCEFISCAFFLLLFLTSCTNKESGMSNSESEKCVIAGCGQECVVESKAPEANQIICVQCVTYACLQTHAICERQENRECGWTRNQKYQECIDAIPTGMRDTDCKSN